MRRNSRRSRKGWLQLVAAVHGSLAVKLTIFVAGLVIVTAGSIGFAGLIFAERILSAQVDHRLAIIASDRAAMLRSYISNQEDEIALIASRTDLKQLLRTNISSGSAEQPPQNLQIEIAERAAGIGNLWLVDRAGDVVAASDSTYLDQSFVDDPTFESGLRRPHVGPPTPVNGRYQAVLAGPVSGDRGEVIGVVMGLIDATPATTMLADGSELGKTGEVLVGAPLGGGRITYVVPTRGDAPVVDETVDTTRVMSEAMAGRSGFSRMVDHGGRDVLAAYEPVRQGGWGVIAKISAAEAYGPIVGFRAILLLLSATILSSGIGASYLVAKRFTLPIHLMAEASAEVAAGRLNVRVPVTSSGEIGTLESSFNLMTTRLAESYESLEQRVRFRTAQLKKVNEDLEEQSKRAEAANRAKSEFLASMSHELRTPLNAIIGFSELLIDEPAEGYDQGSRSSYLESIYDSGRHLLALINDILDLSKVEAGRMELRSERVHLQEVVHHVLTTIEPLAASKRIQLLSDMGMAGDVVADGGKIRQILYNLVSNAIKFTPEAGQIRVRARQDAEVATITVEDTGPGIASEDQERIFHEFQQLDAGPGRQHEGTGLGLALTKRFVELHGGRIWVQSARGEGSQFHFTLPVRSMELEPETPEAETAPADIPVPADPRGLVLIVEDDPRSANLVALYLARGGYRTEIAKNGREALQKAEALNPLAITLDVILPELDGWDVLRELKQNEATRDIPVMVVSIVDNEQLGYALGATDYLVKPIDRHALLSRIDRYIEGARTPGLRPRVLIIDDTPSAIELLQGTLGQAGFLPIAARGGAAGIVAAREERPDVILLDLMMPDVNGFEVVNALKADPETRGIPILILTAKELTESDKDALRGQVAMILQKGSVAGVDLLGWLDDALGKIRPERELLGVAS